MALTYEDSAALMNDMAFRGRVKVACLKYSSSIMIEATNVPAHNTRLRWAQDCMRSPDQTAAMIQPGVVMDPAVQADGDQVTDIALQAATEGVVNKML